jgi:hypothetical protein
MHKRSSLIPNASSSLKSLAAEGTLTEVWLPLEEVWYAAKDLQNQQFPTEKGRIRKEDKHYHTQTRYTWQLVLEVRIGF